MSFHSDSLSSILSQPVLLFLLTAACFTEKQQISISVFGLTRPSDKVYQLLAHGQWFSPGTPASSTTKTSHHDIAEILLKVALNTKNQSIYV
jgi:hypothetical protein